MTPNFALSLSSDGIRLMLRVEDGWHLVDEVPATHPDLTAAMARLRKRATGLAPQLRTKLIIPNDQIRYLSLDDPRSEENAIHAALAEAQPVPVADLVIDTTRGGGRTYVAAVARETLDEAEAFATAHRFQPVCFAAVPPPFSFRGEPFFGATGVAETLLASGETVARDTAPVSLTGEVAAADPEPDAPEAPPSEAPLFGSRRTTPDAEAPEDAPVVFTSRARAGGSPAETLSEALAKARSEQAGEPKPRPAPRPAPVAHPAAGLREPPPGSARLRAVPPPPAASAPAVTGLSTAALAPEDVLPDPGQAIPMQTAAARAVAAHPALSEPIDDTPEPVAFRPPPTQAPEAASKGLFASRRKPQDPEAARRAAERAAEAEKMAIIGRAAAARKTQAVGGKPRYLGLILVALLVLAMAAVAAWAAQGSDILGRLFGRGEEPVVAALPADAEPATGTEIAVGPSVDSAVPGGDLTAPGGPQSTALAPAAERAAPATASTPRLDTTETAEAGSDRPASPEAGEEVAAAEPPAPDPVETAEPEAVASEAAQATPPGTVLSPAEADRVYAATGVWVRAERLPLRPQSEALTPPAVPEISTPDRLPPPQTLALATPAPDRALPLQRLPPAPGTVFPRDERGFILATPEGTLTPDGLLLFAARPALNPPTRPGTEPPPVVPVPFVDTDAVNLVAGPPPRVPPTRPGTVAPAVPEAVVDPAPEADPADVAPPLADTDAVNLIAGPPPRVPPTRPATPDPEDDAAGPAPEPLADTDAVRLVAGPPPRVPPTRPGTEPPASDAASVEVPGSDAVVLIEGAPPRVPPTRAATPGAVPLDGLAGALEEALAPSGYEGPRPGARPATLAPAFVAAPEVPAAPDVTATLAAIVANAPDPLATATAQAVAQASRPDSRPRNFAQVVARARASATPTAPATETAAARPSGPTTGQQVSNATARPTGPIPGSVATAATQTDVMNLREVNLIGVYGRPSARRALVRLANGRYVRVSIGDTLEGGRVTAINDNALNYVVRGRTYALQIPN